MSQICESFNWLTPEFSILPMDKNTVKIKGVAMPPNTVSKNNKRYVDEELRMAARTWIDAPVTPNHAPWTEKRNQKGKVNWMEYDSEDGTMEYVAEVWDPVLVTELRVYKENPSASKIRGVSIEADYLHIRCSKCGKKFFSEEEWRTHLEREHFIKDLPLEPHGIRGRALSIVLAPETPGVQGNTLEVMETAQRGLSQLLNIIVTNNKLKEEHLKEMKRIAVTPEQPHAAVGRGKKASSNLTEQEHECPEGEHWDDEQQKCVANTTTEQEEHQCGEGEHWSEEEGKCVPNAVAEQDHDQVSHECPEGEHWDEMRQQCVLDVTTTEQEEHTCPEGEHWDKEQQKCVANQVEEQEEPIEPGSHYCEEHPDDPRCIAHKKAIHGEEQEVPEPCPEGQHRDPETGECVPDTPLTEPTAETVKVPLLKEKVAPFKLKENAPKLKLGEPFAGYSSFEDCVAKNQDKENPEAYCGQIKHEVEGEMWYRQQTMDKLNEVIGKLNTAEIAVPKDNTQWFTFIKQNMAKTSDNATSFKALKEKVASLPKDDLGWKRIKPYDDTPLREKIASIKPYNDAPLKEAIAKIEPYDDTPLKTELNEIKEALTKKDEDMTVLRRAVEIADENVAVKGKIVETKQKSIEEIAKKTEELEKETKQLKEQLEKETARADNAEDKLSKHPQFKGTAQEIEDAGKDEDLSYTPEKNVKEKRKK